MPFYESVFLARQDLSAQQVTSLTETLFNIVKENGGKVPKTEHWGVRNLAYRIKKKRKAHYVLMNIDAPVAAVQEMERNMRINEDLIRYMTLRVEELEEGPSIMMRAKVAREERSRREERQRMPVTEAAGGREKSEAADRAKGSKGEDNKVAGDKGEEA